MRLLRWEWAGSYDMHWPKLIRNVRRAETTGTAVTYGTIRLGFNETQWSG